MAKSIKLKNDNYWDSKAIIHKKELLSDILTKLKMNVSSSNINAKWTKFCNIKFITHTQGEFIFLKIFIGEGNNGRVNQNAYIDLIGQLGWINSLDGRLGFNAELHPFKTTFTTSNIFIKVIANSNIDYDVWLYSSNLYTRPNYIFYGSERATVVPKWEQQDNEPSGTICELSFMSA